MLQQRESPAYVQRHLGRAGLQLPVYRYGRWLPLGNKAAVDHLDTWIGSTMVAAGRDVDDAVLDGDGKDGWAVQRSNLRPGN